MEAVAKPTEGIAVEEKLTRKTVALICVLTKWDLLHENSDEDNLQMIKEIIGACKNVKDNLYAKDEE